MAETKKETLSKTLEEPIVESEANTSPPSQPPEETGACEVGGDGAEDPREAKPPSIPSAENSAPPAAPVTDLEKKARRAERFGLPVQLSEQEKRNSRAERFGVRSNTIGKIEAGNLEDEKRKARAERFGLTGQSLEDDKVKKKSRLEKFATNPKPISEEEEEKRKARTLRFSGTSYEISKGNSKATAEVAEGSCHGDGRGLRTRARMQVFCMLIALSLFCICASIIQFRRYSPANGAVFSQN